MFLDRGGGVLSATEHFLQFWQILIFETSPDSKNVAKNVTKMPYLPLHDSATTSLLTRSFFMRGKPHHPPWWIFQHQLMDLRPAALFQTQSRTASLGTALNQQKSTLSHFSPISGQLDEKSIPLLTVRSHNRFAELNRQWAMKLICFSKQLDTNVPVYFPLFTTCVVNCVHCNG